MSSGRTESKKLVDLEDIVSPRSPLIRKLLRLGKGRLEAFFGLHRINEFYSSIQDLPESQRVEEFFDLAVERLGLRHGFDEAELSRVPRQGSVVVVVNHPHGLADGLLVGALMKRVRRDFKIIANQQLSMCPELRPWLIEVDPFGGQAAIRKNLQGVRQSLSWLKAGGMLIVFPAGSASSFKLSDRCVTDDPWQENVASLVRKTRATVVPVHLSGRNSVMFQLLSLIYKPGRVALLPRELARSQREICHIAIGRPADYSALDGFRSDRDLLANLRIRTYLAGRGAASNRTLITRGEEAGGVEDNSSPMVDEAQPRAGLLKEIADLPPEQELFRQGSFVVYHATAIQIPLLLREIGRVREITFRAAGEGSGKSCDIDSYDSYYQQLFLWDHAANELAGGYRVGCTDTILRQLGIEGLYTSEFFKFDARVMQRLSPGLELGRSFIAQAYQRRPLSLSILWQGVGAYLAKHPHYRYLFGVVSTSNTYSGLSRGLIVDFLRAQSMDTSLAKWVKPKNPPKERALKRSEIASLVESCPDTQDLSSLVAAVEADGKGIPVLLRHYLKLQGRILGFNVDDNFGKVLDCLIVVDIYQSPERSLKRYLGSAAVDTIKQILSSQQDDHALSKGGLGKRSSHYFRLRGRSGLRH